MKRRIGLHLLFWLAFWFIYAYTYSRYDGNLVKNTPLPRGFRCLPGYWQHTCHSGVLSAFRVWV